MSFRKRSLVPQRPIDIPSFPGRRELRKEKPTS